ncbi:hypothetical protein ACOME3_005882 [Neoechinorhynchus agilis]
MRSHGWTFIRWMDVRVGDVVKLVNGDFFPADTLILNSRNLNGYVDAEPPNRHLYEFVGLMNIFPDGPKIPLGPDHILLRGSQLRNTNWAYGIVLYTGHETKLMMNSRSIPSKMSNLERMVNKQIVLMFTALLVIACSCTAAAVMSRNKNSHRWYAPVASTLNIKSEEGSLWEILMNFLTFIILYNNLVPISLTVTVEIVKFVQALYINWDLEMYDDVTNTRALARTSNLNEELGQVRFIFSDKTGTLTKNIMELRTIACEESDGSQYVLKFVSVPP